MTFILVTSGFAEGFSKASHVFRMLCSSHRNAADVRLLIVNPFTPKHQYMFSPHCSLYISYGTDKENFFNNQERRKLVIISFILMTSIFVLGGDADRENS